MSDAKCSVGGGATMRRAEHGWRAAAVVLVALLTLALAAGCGPRRTAEGRSGAASASARTIRVVRNIGGRAGFQAHFDAWKAAFERDNPGWAMEKIDLGNADGAEYYKSRVASGDMPEVIQTWNLTSYLADNGIIVPLPDDYYERHGVRRPLDYKGKYYTSQGGLQLLGVAVNKGLWDQAGVSGPPATWPELLADLAQIRAADIQPLAFGAKEWSAAMPLSEMLQISMYDYEVEPAVPSWTQRRDAREVTFAADADALRAMGWMAELVGQFALEGALSDGYNEEQRDFYGGKAATWIMGCWIGGDLEANKVPFEVEYWPIPAVPGRDPRFVTNSGGQSGWAISSSAAEGEKHDKAVAVLDAFYDPDVYQLYLNGEAMLDDREASPVTGPKTEWPQAQAFYDNMAANYRKYGGAAGAWRSCSDKWPAGMEMSMMRVVQEMVSGERDSAKLLGMLDADWDNARKGE